MADIYMYVDETGDLGTNGKGDQSRYFGVGSAVFDGQHDAALGAGNALRFRLQSRGLALPRGFHAKEDSPRTRHDVYEVVASAEPRFDFTMLDKTRAYTSVIARGEVYMYKLAWFLHFKDVLLRVSSPGDTVHVAAGTLGTAKRVAQAEQALRQVCQQVASARVVHLATWQASTSFGIQIADYGLWAVQRRFERADTRWWDQYVGDLTRTCFRPWN